MYLLKQITESYKMKVTKLKTAINNRDSIVKLMNKDSELFCKMVRREGVILYDIETNEYPFERVTYILHSGYICTVTMLNGDYDGFGINTYQSLKYMHNLLDNELKKLALI